MKIKVLKGSAAHIAAQETAEEIRKNGGHYIVNYRYEGEWYAVYDITPPLATTLDTDIQEYLESSDEVRDPDML